MDTPSRGKIPQSFIDDILDRTDIVDLIGSRVKLKKTGLNYQACCPFHDEKTPSFSVNPAKQFFYCFGCGAGGNAISFIMEYERSDFPETIETLAKNLGLDVPREHNPVLEAKRKQQASLYDLLQQANTFYQQQLKQHAQKQKAIDYLKGRGLTGEIAKHFQIGFAPDGWDNFLRSVDDHQSARTQQQLDQAGLCVVKAENQKCYDRFRDRLMFPIRDSRGRTIAFGGRAFGDIKPKYLNSPETAVFHKHNELYGLYEALQANRHLERLIMVEGYMDVVALAQFGINWAVATLGTSAGADHMRKVFRHCNEVIFCFDGDAAGRKAATRAMDAVLPQMQTGRKAKFLFLPEGHDPDSLIREIGEQRFQYLIDDAPTLSEHLFTSLADGLQLAKADDKAAFTHRLIPKAALIEEGSFKDFILQDLAFKAGINLDIMRRALIEAAPKSSANDASTHYDVSSNAPSNMPAPPQREKLPRDDFSPRLVVPDYTPLLAAGLLAIFLPDVIKQHDLSLPNTKASADPSPHLQALAEIIQDIKQSEQPTSTALIGKWQAKNPDAIRPLLAYYILELDMDNPELHQAELMDAFERLNLADQRAKNMALIEDLPNDASSLSSLSPEQQSQFLALFVQESSDTE
ncbi:MAG: DNA primase [Pseudomonadales bacterium]|nr:DNA primase [Pseudomonadales bacterium]